MSGMSRLLAAQRRSCVKKNCKLAEMLAESNTKTNPKSMRTAIKNMQKKQ